MWINEDLYYEMKSAYDAMTSQKSCKTCKKGSEGKCKYMSDWSKPMSYNCPLWEGAKS